jgi:hypothetical protein
MSREVGFKHERYDVLTVSIHELDSNGNEISEIDDPELFDDIIDNYNHALDEDDSIETDYKDKKYRIKVDMYQTETQYIGFESF